ncbi:MAG: peptidylprolyl isomerase [Candidatus Kryptoniota bacterium]
MSLNKVIVLFLGALMLAGCAANINDKVIATVDGQKITYGEFKQEYNTNSYLKSDSASLKASASQEKQKFLNLLIDYKLKLLEAKKEHLEESPSIKSEINGYRAQLAVSYVMEHTITQPMVKEIYDRQKWELRAKQVFIPFPKDSSGVVDTLKAFNQAMVIIHDLQHGAPIDSILHEYRGGDSWYVTAGMFLQYQGGEDYENLLYSLKPGEVGPYPVRTAFGYLVVQLLEKRPRIEAVRASHILIPIKGSSPEDTLKAYNRAVAIADSARSGVSFAVLAKDNSADTYSAQKGGDLGFFNRGMMVREFEQAAFDARVGEIVGPVRTRFGYHIIKVTERKPIPPFDEVKEKIREQYLNGGYKADLLKLVEKLKQEYDYKVNEPVLKMFFSRIDSSKRFNEVKFDSIFTNSELAQPLFTLKDGSASLDTLIKSTEDDQHLRMLYLNHQGVDMAIDELAKKYLVTRYSEKKAMEFPEFNKLMKNYIDGILIYHLEQQNVWDKIVVTDSVLKPYYFEHIAAYQWPPRVDISEIFVYSDSLAKSLYDSLSKGADFDTLASHYTQRPGMKEKYGHYGLFADSSNILATEAFKMKEGEISKPIRFEGGYSILRVNRFVPAGPKTFEEARGEVASDYQDYQSKRLQNEWIESLKKEFGVEVEQKTFDELITQKAPVKSTE